MANRSQMTQGEFKVIHQCQSTIVGGAWVCVTSHSQEAENGLISERDIIYRDLKKHWVDFYHYRVYVYKHCQQLFKHHVKVNLASDDTFNTNNIFFF